MDVSSQLPHQQPPPASGARSIPQAGTTLSQHPGFGSIGSQQAPYPCMTWQDTLGNMQALDQWRAAVGLVFDAEK